MADPKTLHIINDLSGYGGAEMTLLRYLSHRPEALSRHAIVVLKPLKPGPSVGEDIVKLGVPVLSVNLNGIKGLIFVIPRLIRIARAFNPDIVSAWLYYPCLLAIFLRIFVKNTSKLLWHIRSLPFVRFPDKPIRWISQRLLALLSRHKNLTIIVNSEASKKAHQALGFAKKPQLWRVIPNAVDTARFAPNPEMRVKIRRDLGVSDETILIGAVGRAVPEKGFPDLFEAFSIAVRQIDGKKSDKISLLIAGRDVTEDNLVFMDLIQKTGLPPERFHLLGARHDINDILTALDLFIVPSRSESFPNVLAEGMATGLICLATDVGDCRPVLNDDRFIAPAQATEALAKRMDFALRLSSQEKEIVRTHNRQRIEAVYTIDRMANSFDEVFETL